MYSFVSHLICMSMYMQITFQDFRECLVIDKSKSSFVEKKGETDVYSYGSYFVFKI